jgi:hypothetical protein
MAREAAREQQRQEQLRALIATPGESFNQVPRGEAPPRPEIQPMVPVLE